MPARSRQTQAEDGFILIEVLVSALILAIVAGAVLTLIAATTRGAAAQRSQSAAYDLAQADQARLRTMRIPELNQLSSEQPRAQKVRGTEYVVRSEAEFVTNKVGRVSCSEASDSQDYIQLTSTVTAPTMQRPVTIQSSVAPENGSLDTAHGPLVVQTVNAAGEPLPGVTVELPTTGQKATTETQGCANFAEVPVGTYKNVTFKGGALINPEGLSEQTKEVTVLADPKNPARLETSWDKPAKIEPEFVYLEPGTGTLRPAPVDSMLVANSTSGSTKPFGTAGGTRSPVQVDPTVYPFKSPSEYTVYAGSCSTNNPGTSAANKVGLFSSVVQPAKILKPQIHVPALELTVTTKEGAEGKTGTEKAVSGATVTLTDLKCKSGGVGVKRTYMTNAGGHLSNKASVEKEGTGPTEAGVPFGAYEVCASATINKELRVAKVTETKVEDFSSKGTVLNMNLIKGTTAC